MSNNPAIHAEHAAEVNSMDPHHEGHHEHVIVRASTLWAVLLLLLAFTALTVGASFAERWISSAFHVEIPSLINAIIALSIAVVKATLVCLFFMQLKYDNKLNAVVLGFTLFAVSLFLLLTMGDLISRGEVYDFKSGEIQTGGQGITVTSGVNTGNVPIALFWREKKIEELGGIENYEKARAEYMAHHGHPIHSDIPPYSTGNRQVVRTGLTPGLYGPKTEPGESGHGGHSGH
jgi:cytochrome c oxidase subunit 4